MAIDSNLFYIALFFAFMLASALAYLIFKQRKQNKAAEKKTAATATAAPNNNDAAANTATHQ